MSGDRDIIQSSRQVEFPHVTQPYALEDMLGNGLDYESSNLAPKAPATEVLLHLLYRLGSKESSRASRFIKLSNGSLGRLYGMARQPAPHARGCSLPKIN